MPLVIAGELPSRLSGRDQELAKRAPKVRQIELRTRPLRSALVYDGTEKPGKYTSPPNNYLPQLYDYESIRRLLNIESLFARICWKYVEQIWSRGWDVVSKTPSFSEYILRRLAQMAYVSDITTQELLYDIAFQLVAYGNTYIRKIRSIKSSGGQVRTVGGKKIIPIAALVVMDTPSVYTDRDEHGVPRAYMQRVRGRGPEGYVDRYEEIPASDVVHISFHRDAGYSEGTPMVIPVIDDIAALRRLEETAEIIAFQASIPMYHFKAGTERAPAGAPEVDDLDRRVTDMLAHGALVTNERCTVDVVQAKGDISSILEFVEYYRKRILSGLGTSPVLIGESDTSNRDTSLVVSTEMHQITKMFQQTIAETFNHRIFNELLLEGGVDIFNEKYTVKLHIPEVDISMQQAAQLHGLTLYQSNTITESEFRHDYLGRDPIRDEERDDLYLNRFVIPKIIAAAEAKTSGGLGSDPAAKKALSQAMPTNQYGTKARPSKAAKRDEMIFEISKVVTQSKDPHKWIRVAEKFNPGLSNATKTRLWSQLVSHSVILNNASLPEVTRMTYDQIISDILNIIPKETDDDLDS